MLAAFSLDWTSQVNYRWSNSASWFESFCSLMVAINANANLFHSYSYAMKKTTLTSTASHRKNHIIVCCRKTVSMSRILQQFLKQKQWIYPVYPSKIFWSQSRKRSDETWNTWETWAVFQFKLQKTGQRVILKPVPIHIPVQKIRRPIRHKTKTKQNKQTKQIRMMATHTSLFWSLFPRSFGRILTLPHET